MLWYYVSPRQERIPVPENQMAALAGSGVLRPTTLLWRDGLPSWISAGEVKPELFLNPPDAAASAPDAFPAGTGAPVSQGFVLELAATLRAYAVWVEVSGWLHGLAGVLSVAVGTAVGYFAWRRPERLTEWRGRLPVSLQPVLDHPWWTVAAVWGVALVVLFTGAQLMSGAARARKAERLGSQEDLRTALRSMGGFFRTTALTLLVGILAVAGALLYKHRPVPAPPVPPPPPPVRDRVTI